MHQGTFPPRDTRPIPICYGASSLERPNQVWCADITYIPLAKGFLYLVAVMDAWSRKMLAWRLSNTMDVQLCLDALEEAWVATARRRDSIPTRVARSPPGPGPSA